MVDIIQLLTSDEVDLLIYQPREIEIHHIFPGLINQVVNAVFSPGMFRMSLATCVHLKNENATSVNPYRHALIYKRHAFILTAIPFVVADYLNL